MSIARVAEIKASSPSSFDDAMREGIGRARKTLHNIRSAWVQDQEVLIDENGEITEYQVRLKGTFVLKD